MEPMKANTVLFPGRVKRNTKSTAHWRGIFQQFIGKYRHNTPPLCMGSLNANCPGHLHYLDTNFKHS